MPTADGIPASTPSTHSLEYGYRVKSQVLAPSVSAASYHLKPPKQNIPASAVYSCTAVLADTPNIWFSTEECFGNEYEPDYSELISITNSRGFLSCAIALVNDGLPHHRVRRFQGLGYRVLFSEGKDCDFRFVDQAITMHSRADIFLLCSGDHRFADLATVLRALGKYVIVCALRACCSHHLIRSANEFIPFPVRQR
jgi:uncharacterized LabA/DUF88 family protein